MMTWNIKPKQTWWQTPIMPWAIALCLLGGGGLEMTTRANFPTLVPILFYASVVLGGSLSGGLLTHEWRRVPVTALIGSFSLTVGVIGLGIAHDLTSSTCVNDCDQGVSIGFLLLWAGAFVPFLLGVTGGLFLQRKIRL